jgi:hypothetical protein
MRSKLSPAVKAGGLGGDVLLQGAADIGVRPFSPRARRLSADPEMAARECGSRESPWTEALTATFAIRVHHGGTGRLLQPVHVQGQGRLVGHGVQRRCRRQEQGRPGVLVTGPHGQDAMDAGCA